MQLKIYADGLKAEEDPGSQSYFYETPKNEKYTNVPSYPMGGGNNQRAPSNWDQSDQSPFGNSYIYGGNTLDGQPDLPTHSSYTAPSPSEEVSFMTSQNICQIDKCQNDHPSTKWTALYRSGATGLTALPDVTSEDSGLAPGCTCPLT